jgi:hypothetical protein
MKKVEIEIFGQQNKYVIPYESDFDNNLTVCQQLTKHLLRGITLEQWQKVLRGKYSYKII